MMPDVRADFPLLAQNPELVYLDSAATSQKPRAVVDALRRYYESQNANIHRGIYRLAETATRQYEGVRDQVARWIGASSRVEVVFTRGTTESVNLVAAAWGRANLKPGDEILATEMEHHSNLVPWQAAARATGATLRHIPVTDEGRLDLSKLDSLLTPRTRLVALTHMSNVLGTINPVAKIAEAARRAGALTLVDAAQSAPNMVVDVRSLGCDFLAFSSHKMLGPTGVGVLWARRELLEAMEPYQFGGDMIESVELDRATWNELPWKFEAGTPNIGGVIAFGAALSYLERIGGPAAVREHEKRLVGYALKLLGGDPRVTLYGPRDAEERGGAISFNFAGVHPHDVATILDRRGVCVRAGHHCCQPLMARYGIHGTTRASVYLYNTERDIDALVEGLEEVERVFGAAPARQEG
jgi:cysteine desulfurase/selenocysteine lyase